MVSETKKPIKGILKTPKPSSPSPPPRDTRREIALQHAHILQDRKDTALQILDNIEQLTDYPLVRGHDISASNPAPSDVAGFLSLIRIMQPTDYDDLIIERNTCGDMCGYALCPKRRRQYKGVGTYKLINHGRKDFDIVEKKELEKWCSQECTRRALYIKVQLNETGAWERAGFPEIQIDLLDETPKSTSPNKDSNESQRQAAEMSRLTLEDERKAAKDAAALAIERGDGDKTKTTRSIDLVVREKKVTTKAEAPSLEDAEMNAATIEGYRSRFGMDEDSE